MDELHPVYYVSRLPNIFLSNIRTTWSASYFRYLNSTDCTDMFFSYTHKFSNCNGDQTHYFISKNIYIETNSLPTPVKENTNHDKETIIEVDLKVFDNLLVGSSNNLAITAAKNVVKSPGSRFNPLFIHGKPGVGKTHLLKTMEESSRSSYYIDSESFLESYVSGIKNQSIDLFKNKIRSVDILLIEI